MSLIVGRKESTSDARAERQLSATKHGAFTAKSLVLFDDYLSALSEV